MTVKSKNYSLLILMLVTVFTNFDRTLMTVLIEEIQLDINVSDAEIGFIFGTAISVFYAIFSIPMGRFADYGERKKLIGCGVIFCSFMIMLSALARSFIMLAICRIGVGAGESSAAPASSSIIANNFDTKSRAMAMSLFNAGVPIGAGLGVFIGGWILDFWSTKYPVYADAPLGLKSWQVPLIGLGLLGLLLSPLIFKQKEPKRQLVGEGVDKGNNKLAFYEAWKAMRSLLPLINLYFVFRVDGFPGVKRSLLELIAFLIPACFMVYLTGDAYQWIALFLGSYCVISWIRSFKKSEPDDYSQIFQDKSIVSMLVGVSFFVFVYASMLTWVAPLFIRNYGVSAKEAGFLVGIAYIVGGLIGTISGGLAVDFFRKYTEKAAIFLIIFSAALSTPFLLGVLLSSQYHISGICYGFYIMLSSLWFGVAPAMLTEMVPERLRAVTISFFIICMTFIGFSMGPYFVGYISDALLTNGYSRGDSLRYGLLCSIIFIPVSIGFLCLSSKRFIKERGVYAS